VTRLAYTEALDDEKAVTAAAFWQRAKAPGTVIGDHPPDRLDAVSRM